MEKYKQRFLEIVSGLVVVVLSGFFIWLYIPKADLEGAKRALESAGYRNIRITGVQVFGCGNGDLYRTGFSATGSTGIVTSGVVCGGILKGSTIRTN